MRAVIAVLLLVIAPFSLSGCGDGGSSTQPPDSRIVFVSDRSGHKQLYIMDINGSRVSRVTNNQYDDTSPKWSPDGRKIAFTRYDGSLYKTYLINPDGSNEILLKENGDNELNPGWFPDGRKIVFQKLSPSNLGGYDSRLYTIDLETGEETAITTGLTIRRSITGAVVLGETFPAVSPSEKIILFSYLGWPRYVSGEIYSYDIETGLTVNLTNLNTTPSALFYKLSWSSDGTKVAYCSKLGTLEIFLMNPDGSGQTNLTADESGNKCNPAFVPGSNFIVFDTDRDGNSQIYSMVVDRRNFRRISDNPFNETEPDAILDSTLSPSHP